MPFRVLLAALGALLALAARTSRSFRAAVTRDLVVEIRSDDGVARHFVFRNRRVTSRSGREERADCAIRFATARHGLRTLLSRHAVRELFDGAVAGTVSLEGNPMQLLWFHDLVQRVVPIGARVRWPTPPGGYRAPDARLAASARITREAAARELDPTWEDARRQREKLAMSRVARGEPPPEPR